MVSSILCIIWTEFIRNPMLQFDILRGFNIHFRKTAGYLLYTAMRFFRELQIARRLL